MKKKSLFLLAGTVMLGLCACSGAGKNGGGQTEAVEKIASDGGGTMRPTAPAGIKIAEIGEDGSVKGAADGATESAQPDGGGIMRPTAPAGIKIAEIGEDGSVKGAANGAAKAQPTGGASAAADISQDGEPIEGIHMYVGSVKDGVLSLVFTNDTDRDVNTAADFQLYGKTAEGFEKIEPVQNDGGSRADNALPLPGNRSTNYDQEYARLFGELPYGEYRIAKTVTDGDTDYTYFADFVTGDLSYGVDYGHSSLYSQEDMTAAVLVILRNFQPDIDSGCELHNIRYTSDDSNSAENLDMLNNLADEGTVYTQCAEFLMDFHSPKTDAGAWNVDEEYTDWQWWLARTDGGDWECVTYGY